MISKICGNIESVDEGKLTISCGGLHYTAVFCGDIEKIKDNGSVYVETTTSASGLITYFFIENKELVSWFKLLVSVTGIGGAMATKILNEMSIPNIISALSSNNKDPFAKISGVSAKKAEQIVLTLSSKVRGGLVVDKASSDAVEAVIALGYKRAVVVAACNYISSVTTTAIDTSTMVKMIVNQINARK